MFRAVLIYANLKLCVNLSKHVNRIGTARTDVRVLMNKRLIILVQQKNNIPDDLFRHTVC